MKRTLAIADIISNAAKLKKKEDKANYLREHDSEALRYILELAFHPNVGWQLPPGSPPYKPCEVLDTEGRLYHDSRTLPMYLTGNRPDLTKLKREMLFIGLLESIYPADAKLLIDVKDKKVKGLDRETVNIAFPGLIPNE